MSDAAGTPDSTEGNNSRRPRGIDTRDLNEGPLGDFVHDVVVSRFDNRIGRLVPFALAGVVAFVAANAGSQAATTLGLVVALGLVGATFLFERDRWPAEDVLTWYYADRKDRWIRDTGGPGPRGEPAATEAWLGAHQPGTVPQIYRVLAAQHTGDPRALARELAALPDAAPLERAWRLWAIEAERWHSVGVADTSELAPLVASLPASRDRAMFESWLAAVDASRRRQAGDRGWIRSLSMRWAPDVRTRLGLWPRIRTWLARFAVVLVFGVSAVAFSSAALTIANQPRPEYAETALGGRGDWPTDLDAVAASVSVHLRSLERALPGAIRLRGPLDVQAFDTAIDEGLPTLVWTTDKIEMAVPDSSPGRRLSEIEVLLGGDPTTSMAILTFDGPSGPRYLYRIDASVVRALREAAGLPKG